MRKEEKGRERANSKTDIILRILIVFFAVMICVSLYFIVKELNKYRKGTVLYDQITDDYVLDEGTDNTDRSENAENSDNTEEADEGAAQEDEAEKADNGIIIPPQINHDGLTSENEDYIGWLRIEGCGIDLPLVQGESDEEYLHTGFNHKYIYQGTLFAESMNRRDFSDPNTIIYGHNMKNRSMFGNLKKYLDEDFADENNTFWISTQDYGYLYRIYSIAIVKADGDAYTLYQNFDDAYSSYISARLKASQFDLGSEPDPEARTVTLSTCYGPGSDGKRLIVQAYRAGVYPAAGCTEEEAGKNELRQREDELKQREAEQRARGQETEESTGGETQEQER